MVITDRIYGKFEIDDPLILEIINSSSFQRLKGISQFGPPDEFYHLKNFYRDEHSIGVMILLKILGASREEQIAGLLHDISHTAFSHTVDWAIGEGGQEDFQDNSHKGFLEKSEIFLILKKGGINPDIITDYKNFKLLEREIPDLCADRLDYSLREFPKTVIKKILQNLTTKQNKIVFKNKQSAYLFGINYLKVQQNHWGGFEAVSRYTIFGQLLKIAMQRKVIEMNDFWGEEKNILDKIKKTKDPDLEKLMKMLKNKSLKKFPKSKNISYKKFRYVDPEFIDGNKIVRISEISLDYKKMLEKAREENKKGIKTPLV